jgi:hypothetical protein
MIFILEEFAMEALADAVLGLETGLPEEQPSGMRLSVDMRSDQIDWFAGLPLLDKYRKRRILTKVRR